MLHVEPAVLHVTSAPLPACLSCLSVVSPELGLQRIQGGAHLQGAGKGRGREGIRTAGTRAAEQHNASRHTQGEEREMG